MSMIEIVGRNGTRCSINLEFVVCVTDTKELFQGKELQVDAINAVEIHFVGGGSIICSAGYDEVVSAIKEAGGK